MSNYYHYQRLHLLSDSPRQLAGQLTTQLPPTTSRLNSWSKTTKLVAPVRAVRDVVAPHTLVNTTATEPALEVGCSARTSLLVLTTGTVGSPVAGAHLGKAPALATEELILRAEVGASNLILSTTTVRRAIALPRGRDAPALGTGELVLLASRKGAALSLILAILAVLQRVAHLEQQG